jgi:hypothetical protein
MVFEYVKHRREANAIAAELGEAAEEIVDEVVDDLTGRDEHDEHDEHDELTDRDRRP